MIQNYHHLLLENTVAKSPHAIGVIIVGKIDGESKLTGVFKERNHSMGKCLNVILGNQD